MCEEQFYPGPFPSSLVKGGKSISSYQRRYRYIKFVDLMESDLVERPESIARDASVYPVFLLCMADLIDMNVWTSKLLKYQFYMIPIHDEVDNNVA